MAKYGHDSLLKLGQAHPDLITVFTEVIYYFDNTILYSTRTPEEQFELFKQGRALIGGAWGIVDKKKVVTYKDGTTNKSNHNYTPSRAVDVAPYPIEWTDERRMTYFAGWVKAMAAKLKQEGKITHDIIWGGDWNNNTQVKDETFMDLVHFEIVI
jgi:peptidoglycan L-alanyl-D-glutamate endopeptidase CwlK